MGRFRLRKDMRILHATHEKYIRHSISLLWKRYLPDVSYELTTTAILFLSGIISTKGQGAFRKIVAKTVAYIITLDHSANTVFISRNIVKHNAQLLGYRYE
jgi:hypothetical protein